MIFAAGINVPLGICALIALSGCAPQGTASHMPPLALLPVAAVQAAASNAVYDARRARVKAHVAAHYDALLSESVSGGGAMLTEAVTLANVPVSKRSALLSDIQRTGPHRNAASLEERIEALTVILMVHGG